MTLETPEAPEVETLDPEQYESTDVLTEGLETQLVTPAMGERQSVDEARMSADFVIVTRQSGANLHGNKVGIMPSDYGQGMRLDVHRAAPIVLFEHGMGGLNFPVGVSETDGKYNVKLGARKATATVQFSQVLPEAAIVFGMVAENMLRMASIGFRPTKAMRLKQRSESLPAGVEDVGRWFQGNMDFVESILMEWSVVARGADPGAMKQLLEKQSINGHRVPESMQQWLKLQADEYRPAFTGVGYSYELEVGGLRQSFTAPTLEGVAQLVKQAERGDDDQPPAEPPEQTIETQEPAPVVQQTIETEPGSGLDANSGENQPATITGQDLADCWNQPNAVDQLQRALVDGVAETVAAAMQPIRAEQQALAERFANLSGHPAN